MTTIYYRKEALVRCEGCGHVITFSLEDVVAHPVPAPGDPVVCPRCEHRHIIDAEEVYP